MKVLFVSSGNFGEINPLIKAQMESLISIGVSIEYELIYGKGIFGYLRNIPKLRKKIKNGNYDIIHAHFLYSALAATLAFPNVLIVSLMGSDLKQHKINKYIIKICRRIFWDQIIVKSPEMFKILDDNSAKIIPNGVNFEIFKPIDQVKSLNLVNWNNKRKHILFAGNSNKYVKNFSLAKESLVHLHDLDVELHILMDIPHNETPYFFNAADVVLLTSLWEGSPNVIKEALACNRPIVSTDCGDVKMLFEGIDGCFITSYDPIDVSLKIKKALLFEKSNGRSKLSNLDSLKVAKKIEIIYKELVNKSTTLHEKVR